MYLYVHSKVIATKVAILLTDINNVRFNIMCNSNHSGNFCYVATCTMTSYIQATFVARFAKRCIVCMQFQCLLYTTTQWKTNSPCVYCNQNFFNSLLLLRLNSSACLRSVTVYDLDMQKAGRELLHVWVVRLNIDLATFCDISSSYLNSFGNTIFLNWNFPSLHDFSLLYDYPLPL